MIRKSSFCCLALIAFVGFALPAAAIGPPGPGCFCTGSWQETPNGTWGLASTCEGARAAAERNALLEPTCAVCDHYFEEVTACMDKDGMKRVDVIIHYKCYECSGLTFPERSLLTAANLPAVDDLLEPASPQLTPAMIPAGNGCGAATR